MITSRQALHRFNYSERDSFKYNGTITFEEDFRIAKFNLAASNTKDKIASWAFKYELFKMAACLIEQYP